MERIEFDTVLVDNQHTNDRHGDGRQLSHESCPPEHPLSDPWNVLRDKRPGSDERVRNDQKPSRYDVNVVQGAHADLLRLIDVSSRTECHR